MKKIKTLAFITIIGFLLKPSIAFAWEDCPKGLVDDPYPGECARYIDTDDDGICDHSQPAPEDRVQDSQGVKEDLVSSDGDSIDGLISYNQPMENQLQPEGGQQADVVKQTSNEKPKDKLFLAFRLVAAHLAVILIYVTYKKAKAKIEPSKS